MARKKNITNHFSGGFSGIPRTVMDSPDYIGLSGNAVKLLNILAYQYRGKNNGDLTVAYSVLKDKGFRSKGTIERARNELIESNLIIETRHGRFTNPGGQCALYALTWQPIDECGGKLDIQETTLAPRIFGIEKNKLPGPQIGHGSTSKQGRQRKRDSHGRYSSPSKQGRFVVVA